MHLYKKTFITIFSFAALLLILIMAVNYFIDGGNQFYYSSIIENKVANFLLDQKSVLVHINYNDRLLQKIMLTKMKSAPEAIMFGSSHSQPIDHHVLNITDFYNASVSGGYLEDDIALYYLFEQRGWKPKTIIICLDPWIINKDFASLFNGDNVQLWKSNLSYEYYSAKNSLLGTKTTPWNFSYEKINGVLEKYSQLITLDYLKASFRQIKTYGFKRYQQNDIIALPTKIKCPTCYIKYPDGALIPSTTTEALTGEQVDAVTQHGIALAATFYHPFSILGSENKEIFENFVRYLVSKHIQVIFYFPPLEPIAYQKFFKNDVNYQSIKTIDAYFHSVAKQYHIKMIGSYNPAPLGLTANDFVDMWHLKAKGVKAIFNSYQEQASHQST